MDKLHCTPSSFIRCIKPNQKMQPKLFNGGEILSQLQCAGMVSVLNLMQSGFLSYCLRGPVRHVRLCAPQIAQLDPRTFPNLYFKDLGLNEDDLQFGVSKAFFDPCMVDDGSCSRVIFLPVSTI
jgi:myosin-6